MSRPDLPERRDAPSRPRFPHDDPFAPDEGRGPNRPPASDPPAPPPKPPVQVPPPAKEPEPVPEFV
jgi:hypothetical protein